MSEPKDRLYAAQNPAAYAGATCASIISAKIIYATALIRLPGWLRCDF
jgi:hypothetical protein